MAFIWLLVPSHTTRRRRHRRGRVLHITATSRTQYVAPRRALLPHHASHTPCFQPMFISVVSPCYPRPYPNAARLISAHRVSSSRRLLVSTSHPMHHPSPLRKTRRRRQQPREWEITTASARHASAASRERCMVMGTNGRTSEQQLIRAFLLSIVHPAVLWLPR